MYGVSAKGCRVPAPGASRLSGFCSSIALGENERVMKKCQSVSGGGVDGVSEHVLSCLLLCTYVVCVTVRMPVCTVYVARMM